MKKIFIKKGQILQRAGELKTKVYKVESGLLRSYTIDAKGKEHVYQFAPENWIIADAVPATSLGDLFIDCLEDAVVTELPKNFEALFQDPLKVARRFEVFQKRIIMLMSASASERYASFLETYPGIVQRVPQKMIASYLGITPEALSRIRKQKSKS
ncbi:MAG: Crp/Fnr family transcriptional regulator [Flavicella sp.]